MVDGGLEIIQGIIRWLLVTLGVNDLKPASVYESFDDVFWWWRPEYTGKVAVSVGQLCHMPG